MHKLLEESKRIKEQADKILKESGIVEILKNYGEVKIGGSYALDATQQKHSNILERVCLENLVDSK